VAAAGAVALAFVARRLPETLRQRRPEATRPAVLLATWRRIAAHPVFVAWAALAACSFGGLFVMLAAGPFVYIGVLGVSPAACGLLLGSTSLAYIAGTFICRHWLRRLGPVAAVQRGALFTLAGGVALVALWALGVRTVWAIALPAALYGAGHGVLQPCSQSGVVGPFPSEAGAASALAGFALAAVAFALGLWLGQAMDGTARALVHGMGGGALLSCAVSWLLVRRVRRVEGAR
jgi:DHA1 family bicyclomycin/chloramphenicol resistance-like MFS transporter